MDRDSGRLLWRRESGLDPLENMPDDPRVRQRMLQQVARQVQGNDGGMTVAGNELVAIVGTSSANAMRGHAHPGNESALLKLDASTGRVAWRRTPAQLDESLADAAFTGDPLLMGDTAYVFAARQQRSGLRELMLVAVSLSDASLRWTEHVSSLSTSRHMQGGFVPPQMNVSGSRLYASDGIATVACFDASLGRVLWTRILPVSQRQLEQGLARASSRELSSRYATPIRVAGGILVNLAPLPEVTVLIDADTGRLLRELRGRAWGGDNLLLHWKSDVISVHPDRVARLDGESFETVWSLDIESSRLQGTPSLGHRFAAVPTERGVLTIDLEQGRVMRQLGTGQPGHAILLDGQIVLSDRAGLVSYLSWEQTSQRLRRAIADQPADPAPALDLARIALEIDRRGPLGEALDAAVEAVARRAGDSDARAASGDEARRMVFEELRELAQHARSDQAEAVGMLLAKLGRLADMPQERATYHLLQGTHDAEGGRPALAVEHFQQVLANERLADTLFQTPRASRRAAVEARRQLGELLEAGDADLYAAFRAEARSDLASLTQGSARAPRDLESLARRYPFAPAAAEAMLEAARAYHVMDRHADALHALRQADDLAQRTDADRGPILGEMVELYLAMDEPHSAARKLRRIARNHPELELVHGETRRTASAWLTEVAPLAEDATTLPLWGPPLSEPRRLKGAPVPSIAPQPRDGVVLFSDDAERIVAMGHDTLEPVWSTKFEQPNDDAKLSPVIVARSEGRIVLWRPGTQELVALLESDGSEAWRRSAQDVADVEQAAGRDTPRRGGDAEREARARAELRKKLDARHMVIVQNAAPFVIHGRPANTTPAQQSNPARESLRTARATLHAQGQRIAWALPSGHFAVLRLRDGQSQWLRRLSDGVLEGIRIGETGLAIWGRTGDDAAASGVSQVFHVETGDPMTDVIETEAPA
ncbi:MAG: PQQ-binding-like beta-propeller repeat protein, partial [Phycisphaeraceae bacterium]